MSKPNFDKAGKAKVLIPREGNTMPRLIISLSDELFRELQAASSAAHEMLCTPETWAQEAVESAIASRRLPNVERARYGARPGGCAMEADYEPEEYPVRLDALRDTQIID